MWFSGPLKFKEPKYCLFVIDGIFSILIFAKIGYNYSVGRDDLCAKDTLWNN